MRVPAMHGFPNRTPASTETPGKTSIVHLLDSLAQPRCRMRRAARSNPEKHSRPAAVRGEIALILLDPGQETTHGMQGYTSQTTRTTPPASSVIPAKTSEGGFRGNGHAGSMVVKAGFPLPRGRRLSDRHLRAMVREVVLVTPAEVDHRRRVARAFATHIAGPELEDARGERGDELAVVRDEDKRP